MKRWNQQVTRNLCLLLVELRDEKVYIYIMFEEMMQYSLYRVCTYLAQKVHTDFMSSLPGFRRRDKMAL
jgi:hypothetical protein